MIFPFVTTEKAFSILVIGITVLVLGGKGLTFSQTSKRLPKTIKAPIIEKITLKYGKVFIL